MRRRPGPVLVMLLTLALGVFFPLCASALILPVCEIGPRETRVAPPSEPTCIESSAAAAADDDATGDFAPICDASGASALAPPRILPIADARLDAVPSCGGDAETALFAPPSDPQGSSSLSVLSQAALLPDFDVALTARHFTELTFVPLLGQERAGVRRTIDHPPRSAR